MRLSDLARGAPPPYVASPGSSDLFSPSLSPSFFHWFITKRNRAKLIVSVKFCHHQWATAGLRTEAGIFHPIRVLINCEQPHSK